MVPKWLRCHNEVRAFLPKRTEDWLVAVTESCRILKFQGLKVYKKIALCPSPAKSFALRHKSFDKILSKTFRLFLGNPFLAVAVPKLPLERLKHDKDFSQYPENRKGVYCNLWRQFDVIPPNILTRMPWHLRNSHQDFIASVSRGIFFNRANSSSKSLRIVFEMKYFVLCFLCTTILASSSDFPSNGTTIASTTKQYKKLLPSKAFRNNKVKQ